MTTSTLAKKAAKALHMKQGEITTLEELWIDQLQDLYSAETQLIEALPKMAKAAHAPALKKGFETHWQETKVHAERLAEILEALGQEPGGKTCQAMKGLIKEGSEAISENASSEVKDAALIAAAQRVEHYEMAGYGCVRTYAELLENESAISMLQQTFEEEEATDKKLSAAAKTLNVKIPKK